MKKTKSMVASKKQETPKVSIHLDAAAIEQVQKMVYLVSITTEDGKSGDQKKNRNSKECIQQYEKCTIIKKNQYKYKNEIN